MKFEMPNEDIASSIDKIMPKGSYRSATNCGAIAIKVKEDINFLQDRIARIKKLQTPNSSVLKTYQSMLESREAVLQWLEENQDDLNISESDVYKAG